MMQACASHILVETQEQAQELKQQVEGGASFEALAKANSTCPSGQRGGALGQFGKGQMVPEFENVIFGELPVGQVSEPFQTQFGWHIVVVTERPAKVWKAEARHILVETEEEATAVKEAIDNGGDFAKEAAEKSKCPSGASQGGALGQFGKGQMVPEFENVIFSDLPIGQISQPFQTQFGWHIVEVTSRESSE